ncbi:hypothetical protein [Alteromonas sp. KUL49]|uniref:hypothetical protein n=1 Tax=Alteromonas sp. KUL49 TaxID=2480798 RepID=UPI00102EDD51|nr:hypothetical protein [Alteromonas sp. KUL49]TAP40759.1 hypothetical protein EYS00_06475 [Alteromonas sp. KUL49]GEA10928.1 hypothetical protein KUL49_13030 [Alteromonas sp. KUL49]
MFFIQSKTNVSQITKDTLQTASLKTEVAVVCAGDGTYTYGALSSLLTNATIYVVEEDAKSRNIITVNDASLITTAEYAALLKRYDHGITLL